MSGMLFSPISIQELSMWDLSVTKTQTINQVLLLNDQSLNNIDLNPLHYAVWTEVFRCLFAHLISMLWVLIVRLCVSVELQNDYCETLRADVVCLSLKAADQRV